jgi:hypothetical protein
MKKNVKRVERMKDFGEYPIPKRPDLMIRLRYGKNLASDSSGDPVPGWRIILQMKSKPTVCRTFQMLSHALERLGGMLDMAPVYARAIPALAFPSEEGVEVWLAIFPSGQIWRGYVLESAGNTPQNSPSRTRSKRHNKRVRSNGSHNSVKARRRAQ